jgi:putative glycosyltransferase (TIGR04348 family)
MNIILVTPAPPNSTNGNRVSANRWAKILIQLGHQVSVVEQYATQKADLMIAIHAWRSQESIFRFKQKNPLAKLIVVLSGTDIYQYIHSHRETTLKAMHQADILLGLNHQVINVVPDELQHRLCVIPQSATIRSKRIKPEKRFLALVVGHLRDVKNPFQAAQAAQSLPATSRIQIHHYGSAHTALWGLHARRESATNQRYHWYGEVSQSRLSELYQQASVLIISSKMEGGANVICEAIAAGTPVLASKIDGNVGLLGEDYEGYYSLSDTQMLREKLSRLERDKLFYSRLESQCLKLQRYYSPHREIWNWRSLLNQLTSNRTN